MMSTTLNLVEHLLNRGRFFQQLGRSHDALRILSRLGAFRELPPAVAEETRFRLGELLLGRRKYHKARRHLAVALCYGPENARCHFLMARALEGGRDGDRERAAEHYRKALELDPTQTDCLCSWGKLAVRLGRSEEAIESFRAAVAQAPDSIKVLKEAVAGLREAGRADEARGLLLAARFRQPRDSRYLKLWNDFQFQRARRQQQAARRAQARADRNDEGPVLLPFVRPEGAAASTVRVAGKILRHDGPSSPTPHTPCGAPLSRQRRVP
jgi:tetratricopeptide (TPR) repeat protein